MQRTPGAALRRVASVERKASGQARWHRVLRAVVVIALVLAGLSVIFGGTVGAGIRDFGFHHFALAVGVLLGAGIATFGIHRLTGNTALENANWLVPAVIVLLVVGEGVWLGHQDRDGGVVADYCSYGAVSNAQREGCLDHVSRDAIDRLDTHAAQFARRDTDECLSDSGPFCEKALNSRLAEDEQR
jgi:hypothetical protein